VYSSVPTSNFLTINGVRLHYLDWGGNGPALVFLSGMGCSVYIFGSIAPRFADWFRVVALDRRGHGDSDYPEVGYDPETLADDLRQFLDGVGIERAVLVGHSMAYVELTRLAVLRPERVLGLVFLDAAYDPSRPDYKAAYQKNPIGR
jgi:pimeloyl-ACP methyl ester carboxylesterase